MIRKLIILISKIKLWQVFVCYSLIGASIIHLTISELITTGRFTKDPVSTFFLVFFIILGFPFVITLLYGGVNNSPPIVLSEKNMKEKKFPIKEAIIELICRIDICYQLSFYCPIAGLLFIFILYKYDKILANLSENSFFAFFFGLIYLLMSPAFAINIIQDIHFNDGNS